MAALLAVWAGLPAMTGAADEVVAAKSRTQLRDIVIADDAPPAVRYAAEEFQRFFAEASGQKLPIVSRADATAGHVYIGLEKSPPPGSPSGQANAAPLGEEDLRYAVRGDNVHIVGGGPRGALYGVYTFCEDVLGVRFLAPDHTHVPRLDATALMKPRERTFRPVFKYRAALYRANYGNSGYGVRLRNNTFSGDPRFGGVNTVGLVGHTFHKWVNTEQYGKEHPEYFALIEGKRRIKPPMKDEAPLGTQPCLTNPDVRRLIVEGAVRDAREHPEWKVISVAQNDNKFYCRCPNCEAAYNREGATMAPMLDVVNAAADAVAKVNPQTLIGTYAYQYTRRPPKYLRPRGNVLIQFPTIEACQMHGISDPNCPIGKRIADDLAGWGPLTPHLYAWCYFTIFPDYLLPCPNLRTIEPNIRLLARHGVKGSFMQGSGSTRGAELEDLRNYVISSLMWDPQRSGDALVDEFLRLHYATAYPAIRKYVDLINDPVRLRNLHFHPFGAPEKYGINAELAHRAIALMEQARQAADDDAVRRRVEKASLSAYRAAIAPAVMAARSDGKISHDEAQAMRASAERFFALCDQFQVNYVGEGREWSQERARLVKLFEAAGAPLKVSTAAEAKPAP